MKRKSGRSGRKSDRKAGRRTDRKTGRTIMMILCFALAAVLLLNGIRPANVRGTVRDEPAQSLDYLVIGDSESVTSVSPMQLWEEHGFVGYNCGVPGQLIRDTRRQFADTLTRQSPKAVLLETNLLFRKAGILGPFLTYGSNAFRGPVSMYSHWPEWRQMLRGTASAETRDETGVFKGFEHKDDIKAYTGGAYSGSETAEKSAGGTAAASIGSGQLRELNRIIQLCRDRHITLILYCTPSPVCWSMEKHLAAEQYAKQQHLPFLDLNLCTGRLGIDWQTDTADKGDHLNVRGAEKVTEYLGNYLEQHSVLPDRRGTSVYADWDRKYRAYTAALSAG